MSTPPLRAMRGSRRVWSSDEEDNVKPAKPITPRPLASGREISPRPGATNAAVPRIALSARVVQGAAPGSSTTVTPRQQGSATPPLRSKAMNAVGLGASADNAAYPSPRSGRNTPVPGRNTPVPVESRNDPFFREELRKELRAELSTATSAIQQQARDWKDFLSEARDAVRSGKFVVQSGGSPSGGSPSGPASGSRCVRKERHNPLGDDIATITGGISASKVIDASSTLIWKLEDALLTKAGFIGGLFHTWRCEIVLQRAERNFGFYKDEATKREALVRAHKHEQAELLVAKMLLGGDKGLLMTCFRDWKKLQEKLHKTRLAKNRIHLMASEWLLGKTRGLLETCLKAWIAEILHARHASSLGEAARKHQEEVDALNAKIQGGMDDMMKRHARAKQDLFVVLAKWAKGDRKGLMEAAMAAWSQWMKANKDEEKRKAVMKEVMVQWFQGETKGLITSVFAEWKHVVLKDGAIKKEREKLAEFLSGHQALMEEEEARRRNEEQARKERAQESVRLMVRKWELGNTRGLLSEVFSAWRGFAAKAAAISRNKGATQTAMAKFLEGDRRGLLHTTFSHWKADFKQAKQDGWHAGVIDKQQKELDDFMSKELGRYQAALDKEARARARSHNTAQQALLAWEMGNKKAVLLQTLKAWKTFVVATASSARSKNSVRLALLKFVEGDKKAIKQSCFQNWQAYARDVAHAQAKEHALDEERRKMDGFLNEERCGWVQSEAARRREAAHNTVKVLMEKWARGDKNGLLAGVLTTWNGFVKKRKNRERQHEAAKGQIMRWLEGDKRALTQMCWTHWVHFKQQEDIHRHHDALVRELQAQRDGHVQDLETRLAEHISKSKTHLLKYWSQMMGAQDPVFLVMVMAQWRAHCHGEKSAEMQRNLELELREQSRLHDIAVTQQKEKKLAAMMNMGFVNDRTIKMKWFLAWSDIYQKDRQARLHKMKRNKVLDKFGQFMDNKFVKSTPSELMLSCLQAWMREAHHGKIARHMTWLDEQRVLVERLTSERLALAEQLTIVYQQLDAVTDTLQKELKTKEELAKELRDANEQIFHANFGGSCHIDIASIIASRPGTPSTDRVFDTTAFRRDKSPGARSQDRSSAGAPSSLTTPRQQAKGLLERTKTPPASRLIKALSPKSPPRTNDDSIGPSETSALSPGSECNWGNAIPRLREKGYLHGTRF